MACKEENLNISLPTGAPLIDFARDLASYIHNLADGVAFDNGVSMKKLRLIVPSELAKLLVFARNVNRLATEYQAYQIGELIILAMNQKLAETHTAVIINIDNPEEILYKINLVHN